MRVAIDQIQVGPRLRGLREAVVLQLMDSIGQIGLQTPISLASGVAKREGGGADVVSFTLVAGRHRLEACRRLGWDEIDAAIVQMDAVEAQLWEVDENLCRADLIELERDEHLARRKELYEKLRPETRHGGNLQPSGQFGHTGHPSFAADTADKIGIPQRTIRRSIRRVEAIDEKVRDRIRDNPEISDSGVELDALAGMEPAEQRKAVALVESGQAAGIRDARKLMEPPPVRRPAQPADADEKQYRILMAAWNAASQVARERFLAAIDAPVADSAAALRIVK